MIARDSLFFVAGLHGNEMTPYYALCSLGIPVILGNPRAAHLGRRFVERDLNASFGVDDSGARGSSLEEKRAEDLLALIPDDRAVVDFHTFSCVSPPFVIIVDAADLELARRSGISRVVLMTHNIKAGRALLNHRRGISPEVGQHGSEEAWSETITVSQALLGGSEPGEIELYEAVGIIDTPGSYENFTPHPQGFTPVLSGEKAYAHHGLKTRRIEFRVA